MQPVKRFLATIISLNDQPGSCKLHPYIYLSLNLISLGRKWESRIELPDWCCSAMDQETTFPFNFTYFLCCRIGWKGWIFKMTECINKRNMFCHGSALYITMYSFISTMKITILPSNYWRLNFNVQHFSNNVS